MKDAIALRTIEAWPEATSARIRRLKQVVLACPPAIYIERARFWTASYRESEGEPTIVRRALAFAQVVREMTLRIAPDELIVGNRSPFPRMGVLSPEMATAWIVAELDTFPTRPQDKFQITEADKQELREEILPYWQGRTLQDHILATMPAETMRAWQAKVFSLAQTDKGQGHIIPDYPLVLQKGLKGILADVRRRRAEAEAASCQDAVAFYRAATIALEGAMELGPRYARLARHLAYREADPQRRRELKEVAAICERVPNEPAETFHQALQSIWLLQVLLQCESNASSISPGRFDQYIYPYYQADLDAGRLTPLEASELLECLWIKYNEIVAVRSAESARYFAGFPIGHNIVVGGQTANGREASNPLSYLCLQATAHVALPQPNIGVRLHATTPESLLAAAASVIRQGFGMPQLFNDEVVIPALLRHGVALEDARDYGGVGCVEISIPAKTYGLHDIAMLNLAKILELATNNGLCRLTGKRVGLATGRPETLSTYEALEKAMMRQLEYFVEQMVIGSNVVDQAHAQVAPTPFLSCFVDDCLAFGKDITAGGAHYNFSGVQGVGIANTGDSLAALKEVAYERREYTLAEIAQALDADFAGYEALRQLLLRRPPKYGNDLEAVDGLASAWAARYCRLVERYRNPRGGMFQGGHYTVSAHVPLGAQVGATPDGRRAREPLADGGLSPMRGMDTRGPTAVLRSVGKIDQMLSANGTLLNLKLMPDTLAGDKGLSRLVAFLRTFVALKVMHVQFNVVSADLLREAQTYPELYRSLVVRVAGYSAYFAELDKTIQDEIIARTEHQL